MCAPWVLPSVTSLTERSVSILFQNQCQLAIKFPTDSCWPFWIAEQIMDKRQSEQNCENQDQNYFSMKSCNIGSLSTKNKIAPFDPLFIKEIIESFLFCMYLGFFYLAHKAKWVKLNGKTLQVVKNSLHFIHFSKTLCYQSNLASKHSHFEELLLSKFWSKRADFIFWW